VESFNGKEREYLHDRAGYLLYNYAIVHDVFRHIFADSMAGEEDGVS
jgi:hypothetical protein